MKGRYVNAGRGNANIEECFWYTHQPIGTYIAGNGRGF